MKRAAIRAPQLIVALLILIPGRAPAAEDSHCADCHIANPDLPSHSHVVDWQSSIHGRREVGCEDCHGGNATTFRKFLAHRGIIAPNHPDSPLHPANVARTCGSCHGAILSAYTSSPHWELLKSGADTPPTCTSCHGSLALQRLGSGGLKVSCVSCHGEAGAWPSAEYTSWGQTALSDLRETEKLLKSTRKRVKRMKQSALRHEMEALRLSAGTNFTMAVEAGHSMDTEGMSQWLETARRELDSLVALLERH